MPFIHRRFDVPIERRIDPDRLAWPSPHEVTEGSALGGNQRYQDLRDFKWENVRQAIEAEGALVRRIEASHDPEEEAATIDEERLVGFDPLWELDPGVAAAALAISASRCIPFMSCNAGALGGIHIERYPRVVFYLSRALVPVFTSIAEEVEAGLSQNGYGEVEVYGQDIQTIMRFGQILYERREEIAIANR